MKFVSLNGNRVRFRNSNGNYRTKTLNNGYFDYNNETYSLVGKDIILSSAPLKSVVAPVTPVVNRFDINERFEHLETFVDMCIEKHTPSVVICGDPGLGKSYTVMERLDTHGLKEGVDYTVHKGYTTPKGLYCMLYENQDGIIVIDDMDSVFKDPTSLNLLKAALDSYDKRIVSWNSMGFIDDGLPKMFEFRGQIIFITNKDMDNLDEAVKSRSLCVDVTMTPSEKIDRMRTVADKILPEISLSTKNKVIDIIEEKASEIKELNFRTMIKATKIYEATGNERAVDYMLYNS